MIRILIVDNQNNFRTQMVAAWLQSFDCEINAVATDTIGKYSFDAEAKIAMNKMNVELSDTNVTDFNTALSKNWDFIIVVNHCIEHNDKRFVGNVMYWHTMNLHEFTNETLTKEEFYNYVCDKMRFEALALYTQKISPTDMIGLDNCGAHCDLP